MTDNPAPYRSNMAVSDRVDRAWAKGYEVGRHEWKRVAIVEFVVGLYVLLRRHRIPPLVWFFVVDALLLAAVIAVVLLPVVGIILILRAAIRHHSRSTSAIPAPRGKGNLPRPSMHSVAQGSPPAPSDDPPF